jgi:14-3-3 protein epsilon
VVLDGNITQIQLAANHPLRLGVVLNYSDFYNEVQNSPNRACHHAKLAVHDALAELHSLPEEPLGNCTYITQLLLENLTI